MKPDRFFSRSIRKAGVLLAGLFLTVSLSAGGGGFHIGRIGVNLEPRTKNLAKALASEVVVVQKRFDENRRALRTVQGSNGRPAYLRQDVVDLMALTEKDLNQAIEKAGPDLGPLEDWSAAELGSIQEKLGPPLSPKTAGLFTPQAVAVVASLGSPAKHASPKAATPPPDTIPAETSNSLLDEVGKVVSTIFTLAANDDLEVKVWVGSTAPRTAFSFWPLGLIKKATPAPHVVRTDGKLEVIRGLYAYNADWSQGAVINRISYPNPAAAPAGQTPSERLDLVKGSRFFCCRFDQSYCHHVDNDKDCRP